jgi:predicted O-methyltransferase YrrM
MAKGLIRDFYRYSSEGWGPGWLVPDMLKKRWHLILGDSRKILPRLLRDLGQIDMFLHDCLHTYDHMIFEYSVVWKHLAHEGILASDDVEWNIAFYDFCRAVKARRVVIGWRLGLAAPKNI